MARIGGLPPPGGPPLFPPDPPLGGPPFCARIGKANRAIAKVQNATGFKHAIPDLKPRTGISQILYRFFADCRISLGPSFERLDSSGNNFTA